jgi:hypothetical protein
MSAILPASSLHGRPEGKISGIVATTSQLRWLRPLPTALPLPKDATLPPGSNRYLRTLFMQGARVILLRPANWARHSFGPLPPARTDAAHAIQSRGKAALGRARLSVADLLGRRVRDPDRAHPRSHSTRLALLGGRRLAWFAAADAYLVSMAIRCHDRRTQRYDPTAA